jgi:hypothetical protein
MVMNGDGDTWMWLADSGANHHMTSQRADFCDYRPLHDWLWVQGISTTVVGIGSDRILAILRDVVHVPKLSRHTIDSSA